LFEQNIVFSLLNNVFIFCGATHAALTRKPLSASETQQFGHAYVQRAKAHIALQLI
jgi:hypothetical protein